MSLMWRPCGRPVGTRVYITLHIDAAVLLSIIAGLPIPEDQLRKLQRNLRKPSKREVKGFAIELSDSDEEEAEGDTNDAGPEPQSDEKLGASSTPPPDAPPTRASPAKAALVEHTWELLAAVERLG